MIDKVEKNVLLPKIIGATIPAIINLQRSLNQVLDRVFNRRATAINALIDRIGLSDTVSFTGGGTATKEHQVVFASGTNTVNIYTAVGNLGREITVINIGTGTITVDFFSSETVYYSGADVTTLTMNVKGTSITLISDGANWWIK